VYNLSADYQTAKYTAISNSDDSNGRWEIQDYAIITLAISNIHNQLTTQSDGSMYTSCDNPSSSCNAIFTPPGSTVGVAGDGMLAKPQYLSRKYYPFYLSISRRNS